MKGKIPYGYKLDSEGRPILDPEKAPYVAMIFEKYLNGISQMDIMKWLNEVGAHSPTANNEWKHNTIGYLISNSKYTGVGGFPPIITKEMLIQVEEIRRKSHKRYDNNYYTNSNGRNKKFCFTAKLVCAKCNRQFTSHRVGNGKTINKIHVWRCGNYIVNNMVQCEVAVANNDLEELFTEIFKKFFQNYEALERAQMGKCKNSVESNEDVVKIDLEIKDHLKTKNRSADRIVELLQQRTNELWKTITLDDFKETTEELRKIIKSLDRAPDYFDAELFNRTIKQVTLYPSGKVTFIFLNGITIHSIYKEYSKRKRGKQYG